MKAIPVPMRERNLHFYSQGQSTCEITANLGYSVAAVRRVRQQFKTCGTLDPGPDASGWQTSTLSPSKRVPTLLNDE